MLEIPLNRGLIALVDDADAALVAPFKWYAHPRGYVVRARQGTRETSMHRLIASPSDGFEVDHKNGVRSDNRRANLRVCTHRENMRNKRQRTTGMASRFKGVWRQQQVHKWQAGIGVNDRKIHLGLFDSELAAAFAYDRAAREYFGEFALVNFPMLDAS